MIEHNIEPASNVFFFFFFVLRPAAVFQNMTTQRGRDYEYELVLKINR